MIKNYAKFEELDPGCITPKGWMRDFLNAQKDGLTGHIEVAGYPFDRVGWDRFVAETELSRDNPGWWAYEQTAYHLDGLTKLAELLGDRTLRKKAQKSFDHVLNNADPDGYLGPKQLKKSDGWNRWPHVVFFRALLAKYAATRDKTILDALCRHYLEGEQKHDRARDVINVGIMLRLYLLTGEKKLLENAERDFASYNETCRDDNCAKAQLSPKKAYAHGVTYNEYAKLGALLYICTGKKDYLKPSVNAYKKIDRYQMLPDGLHCSNEFLLDNDYMQSHETCDIADYTWALHYLLEATGKGVYADKIEKCVLNAGVGSVSEDFRALQYFSCANQVVLDRTSNHNDFFMGDKWMSYRPNPGTECCAGNVNRFMPNFCSLMWMKKGRGVAAVFYGASEVRVGSGNSRIKIEEKTGYPFDDTVQFLFSCKKARKLSFYLRIPGWCASPAVSVNGSAVELTVKDGFAKIDRVFADGDRIVLELPAQIEEKRWGRDGVYFERGPLLFAYGMKGTRTIDEKEKNQTPDFPAYNIYPDRPFNYAPVPGQTLRLERVTSGKNPFAIEDTPYAIKVKAVRVPAWKLTAKKTARPVRNLYTRPWKREPVEGRFIFTPRYPLPATMRKLPADAPVETITLVPYGAAKVRITVFPALAEKK